MIEAGEESVLYQRPKEAAASSTSSSSTATAAAPKAAPGATGVPASTTAVGDEAGDQAAPATGKGRRPKARAKAGDAPPPEAEEAVVVAMIEIR